MSQHDIYGTTMGTDIEEDASDNDLTKQLVLGLAAHPLSSCNPPSRELPDLFDSLIASEGRLREQVIRIDKVGQGIAQRLANLRNRLHQLRAANAYFVKEAQTPNTNKASRFSKKRQVFEAQEGVLRKMCLQVAFIHDTFIVKIRGMTMSTIKAHQDIFDEFLGQRHAHPGIQVADSTKLLCTPDCEWYQKHGPYEWSKKPYSNIWWAEMNNTDWDWLRMKEHFSAAVSVGGGKVTAMYDMLQANCMKFVPAWFWAEDFETWTLHGDVESVKNTEGRQERQVVIKVRFNKSSAMIQRETAKKLKEMEKARTEQENAEVDSALQTMDNTTAEVDKIGEEVIDQNLVFNGMASMAGVDRGGPQRVQWLVWWGFERWHAGVLQKRARARQAGVQ